MYQENIYNIANTERLMRIVLGVGLIFDVLHGAGPLGLAALIPLASIYPIMTGFLGYDPIYGAFGYSSIRSTRYDRMASKKTWFSSVRVINIGSTERLMRVTLGVGLIVDVLLGAGPLGLAAFLPLVSIYPIMSGFLGYDPVYAAFGYSSVRSEKRGRTHSRKNGLLNRATGS